jgi:histidyl-tRNA synthetase
VLVSLPDETARPLSDAVAQQLRASGVAAEVAAAPQKFGKQIRYAERRGIPYVWFYGVEGGRPVQHQVKDIRSGEQRDADPATWTPPEEDLWPRVVSTGSTNDTPTEEQLP